jgi:hypothetical protein
VLAYLRRDRSRTVLVIANLGTKPLTGVAISSPGEALQSGRYAASALYGRASGAPLQVAADGRLTAYAPIATLGPMQTYVLALSRRR